ncbi:reverse transcriptase domain-containing protein [Brevibacterium aurantiacum]|uniref:Reverse transcriptase domain-containing protein n=1 Tax=Brevibacterium aurantiacum TaxID=273384 RepID=A0A2A3YX49_BREAU|nr:reverse transcriptase domain-containing protein [Brevibacterium aurantiacum]PCC43886.1 hypothetical protein CIK65_04640 [Brevibacterium aurantiacum]
MFKISEKFVRALKLGEAASEIVSTPFIDMPELISERALKGSEKTLSEHAATNAIAGYSPMVEVIPMPKRGYGPRPVAVLSASSRVLYESIIQRLAPGLPEPSRKQGFDLHLEFGVGPWDREDARIVDLDVAACYEYIDHRILQSELALQGLDANASEVLSGFLRNIFSREVGIPQALPASHLISDAYLERMERGLQRAGYRVNRFADDFRVIARDLSSAHKAIEIAVEEARSLGLTLADGKTNIRSPQDIRKIKKERDDLLQKYRDEAIDDLGSINFIQVDYDEFEIQEIDAADEDVDFAALMRIVEDWVASDPEQLTLHSSFGSRALRILKRAPDRIPDQWLIEIVSREPRYLRAVLLYVSERKEQKENWQTLSRLAELPRTSSWGRVWLLSISSSLPANAPEYQTKFLEWATTCLADKTEIVRAEAAWTLAGTGNISIGRVADLFVEASELTQCGIAAVAGRLDAKIPSGVGNAISGESRLVRSAYTWGTQNAS